MAEERIRSAEGNSGVASYEFDSVIYRNYATVCKIDNREYSRNTVSGTHVQSTKSSTMTDYVTKGYKSKVAKGDIINNPMTRGSTFHLDSIVSYQGTSVNYHRTSSCPNKYTDTRSWEGSGPSSRILAVSKHAFSDDDVAYYRNLAVSKAFANISLSEMQLLATLGEGKETVKSLVKILRAVDNLIRRKSFKTFKEHVKEIKPKDLEKAYMSLRYELRPLYYDCLNAIRALQAVKPKNDRQTFRGSAEGTIVRTKLKEKEVLDGLYVTSRTVSEQKVSARAGVMTGIEQFGTAEILGLYEIPQSLWELVPLSFVVDWFVNVGTTIASWTPKPQFKTLAAWVTVKTETTYTTTVDSCRAVPYGTGDKKFDTPQVAGTPLIVEVNTTYSREPNPSRPILPQFDVKLDYLKLLDLAIILKNRVF